MNFYLRVLKNVFKQLKIILKLRETFDLNQRLAKIFLFSVSALPKCPNNNVLTQLDGHDDNEDYEELTAKHKISHFPSRLPLE